MANLLFRRARQYPLQRAKMLVGQIQNMKWKIFGKKLSLGNSRRENLEEYEKDYISRIKEDINSEFL